MYCLFFFFKQKTAYEMRISDWSSDVCSSDLEVDVRARVGGYLEKVHFTDGAIVPEGALLFTIDQRPFKTAVAEAEANLKIAAAEVDYTKRQLERARNLSTRGNISDRKSTRLNSSH